MRVGVIKIKGVSKNSISFDAFKEKFDNSGFFFFDKLFQTNKSNFHIRIGNTYKHVDLLNYGKKSFNNNKFDTHV